MIKNEQVYAKYEDESGEEYYCPVQAVKDSRMVSEWELDDCVEASTAGRYAGNLNLADRPEA